MQFSKVKLLCLFPIFLSIQFGCAKSPPNAAWQHRSLLVKPGANADFSFYGQEERIVTISIAGDCNKSISLFSTPFMAVSERLNALPGVLEAYKRGDLPTVERLVDQEIGPDSPLKKLYFTKADVLVSFEAPPGRLERTYHVLPGQYMFIISNESSQPAKIEVSFMKTP